MAVPGEHRIRGRASHSDSGLRYYSLGMSRTPAYAKVGKYLASVRETAGMSQEQLAKKMGRVQSFVAKIETGNRRLDVVEFAELAKALGVSPQRLLDGILRQLR
jgi:hypothetical protein